MNPIAVATVIIAGMGVLAGLTSTAPQDGAKSAPTLAAQPAGLSSLEFLSGAWSASNADGFTEEHWSKPYGTSIMGMFRWCKPGGEPSMFEILTISSELDGVYLRLRHFSPKLVAKEDKDAPMTMKLESAVNRKAVFKAHSSAGSLAEIVYECPTPDRLLIDVVFTPESKRDTLKFDLKRGDVSKPDAGN